MEAFDRTVEVTPTDEDDTEMAFTIKANVPTETAVETSITAVSFTRCSGNCCRTQPACLTE